MKIFSFLVLVFCFLQSPAQILKDLRNKVVNKVKNEKNAKVAEAKVDAKEKLRKEYKDISSEFDSTDYEYALLLSDNAGLFATKQKGESRAKFMKMGTFVTSALDDIDLTDEENANLNLELGQTGYAMGRFVFAEKRFKTARNYFQKASLTDDIGFLRTVSSLGLLYTSMGRFSLAQYYMKLALDARIKKFGEKGLGVAAIINNQAVLYFNLARYNEAEKEFEKAVDLARSNDQQSAMPYAIILNNQAILFQSLGRYDEATKKLQLSIDIAGKIEGGKAKQQLKFYSNLALLYQQMNRYADAESTYHILENKYEIGKPEYANLLNNLAILHLVMNKEEGIEDMLKRSASIYQSTIGEQSPAYAKAISDLGNYYRYKRRYEEAEPLLEKALKIREGALGTMHPLYVQSQEDMAILQWKKKDWTRSGELYRQVMEKSLDFINNYFTPMSEAEKTKYWDLLSPRFQRFFNFALDASAENKNLATDLFEYRIATKGLLLSSTRKVTRSILASGNEELIRDYSAWLEHKEELSALYVYSKEELKEQNVNLDSLQAVANAMEKKLSERSKVFAQFYFASKTKLSDVQATLKDDEAMVEIIRLQYYDQNFTDSSRYLAMVVDKKNQQPELVLLPDGPAMENDFSKNYQSAIKKKKSDEQSYQHYWAPIENELKNKKTVFISSDGVFSQININTLSEPGKGFLINRYEIVLLSNPGDILENGTAINTKSKTATLIGYPDFGSDRIPELPATQVEVDEINKVLKTSGYSVNELVQKDASETNLKNAKEVNVLHIATHGYFLKDVVKIYWPIGVHADNAKDNVLLRSGLILAGATSEDRQLAGLDSVNNGVITSYEAMNLDLEGTGLVVLSACETGLGEIRSGEGVYGLQRAFLTAGAHALIMSLWKVDDMATQQLMNLFYSNWIRTGDKQKAFRQAQMQLMANPKYKEPFFWGAFVMMGE
jgi:CHAT domain-containing protein